MTTEELLDQVSAELDDVVQAVTNISKLDSEHAQLLSSVFTIRRLLDMLTTVVEELSRVRQEQLRDRAASILAVIERELVRRPEDAQ